MRGGSSSQRSAPTFLREVMHAGQRARPAAPARRCRRPTPRAPRRASASTRAAGRCADLERDLAALDRQAAPTRSPPRSWRRRATARPPAPSTGDRAAGSRRAGIDRGGGRRATPARRPRPDDHVGDQLAERRRPAGPERLPRRQIDASARRLAREHVDAGRAERAELQRRGGRIAGGADRAAPHAREHRARRVVGRAPGAPT